MLRGKMLVGLFFCISMLLACCLHAASQSDGPLSLIQLIANPEKYDGKQVQVVGFLRLEFEGDALYLHEDDYKNGIYGNAIGIGVTRESKWSKGDVNMRYVMVVGTFRAGKSNLHTGTIVKITNVLPWPVQTPAK
jgi:hypothetical protein